MVKKSTRYPFIAFVITGLTLTAWCAAASAQSPSDNASSVAEAARRAREQKKNSAKPARTLTNDDLPAAPAPGANAAVEPGSPAATDENAVSATGEGSSASAHAASDERSKQEKAENAAKLEHARKELAQAQSELDVMQRKLILDSDSYYSKTDFASDKEGKTALDAEAQQINDKNLAVKALKAKVADLEALLGETSTSPADKDQPQP